MDDRANWSQWTSWLFRLEGEMRYQGRSHQSLKQSHWHSSCMLFRVSHSALCLTRALWPRGSCPGRRWDSTPAWSAPTITPGSSTPPATGSASSKFPPRLASSARLALTLPSMPEIRLPVHWKRHSVCEPWTNQNYSPTNPGSAPSSRSLAALPLSSLFVSFFNIPRIWDDRKSISGKRKTSQCILKSSLVPQCSHPCISCEDAAPASPGQAPTHLIFSALCRPDTRAALSLVSCPTFGLSLAVTGRLLTSGLCNLFSHRIPLIPAAPHLSAAWGTRTVSKLNFSSFFLK